MNRIISPLERDPALLDILSAYKLDRPSNTIRLALKVGHSEQSLRARIAFLRSKMVQVPFTEDGAGWFIEQPSWKVPYSPGLVHACLVHPEKVADPPHSGWGPQCGLWQSYDREASGRVCPYEGPLSPKRWSPEDSKRKPSQSDYAPHGTGKTEHPRTRRYGQEGSGQSAVGRGAETAVSDQPSAISQQEIDQIWASDPNRLLRAAGQCVGAASINTRLKAGQPLNLMMRAALTAFMGDTP